MAPNKEAASHRGGFTCFNVNCYTTIKTERELRQYLWRSEACSKYMFAGEAQPLITSCAIHRESTWSQRLGNGVEWTLQSFWLCWKFRCCRWWYFCCAFTIRWCASSFEDESSNQSFVKVKHEDVKHEVSITMAVSQDQLRSMTNLENGHQDKMHVILLLLLPRANNQITSS